MRNKQVVLAARPKGWVEESSFAIVEAEVPAVREGEVLTRVRYLSLDPYMRGRMEEGPSYAAPQPLGEVMVGGTVAEVLESRNPGFRPGELVVGTAGLAGVPGDRRGGPEEDRHLDRPRVGVPRVRRHAGRHRLVRPPAARRAEAGRDGGGLRRGRRGGERRRAAREAPRVPGGGHRRRRGEVRSRRARAGLRRLRGLQGAVVPRRTWRPRRRAGSTWCSRTWAARSSTPRSRG